MSAEGLLIILFVGLIAGWLAGQIVRGTGYGLVADICLGIVGALIGSWLFPSLGLHLGGGIIASIISATIGAVLLLVVLRLVPKSLVVAFSAENRFPLFRKMLRRTSSFHPIVIRRRTVRASGAGAWGIALA